MPAYAAAPVITSLGQVTAGLYRPTRIAIDSQANLYIADPRLLKIQKWDMYGRLLATYSGFPVKGGVTVTPDGSRLYVCGMNSVSIVDAGTGAVIGVFGKGEGEFGYAFDIDLDAQGNVYVADGYALTIRVYDPQGKFKYSFGGKGVVNGTFNSISVLAVHPVRGEVFVADSSFPDPYYPKVQVFTLGGVWLRSMDSRTAFGAALYTFGAIAFDDSGRGYFFNQTKSNMSILDLPTTYRSLYGVEGSNPGQFLAPRDAVFDAVNKRLIVLNADSRLEYFGIDGGANPVNRNVAPGLPAPVSPIGGTEVASATPALTFGNAVDEDGDVLTYNVRLQQNGQTVAEYTGIAQGAGQTVAQVTQALAEDATYTWSVQAFDGKLASDWSAPQSFVVNAVQEPPGVPVPLSPIDGAEVASATPALTFGNASDPDSALLTYNVRLLKDGIAVAEYAGIAQGAGQTAVEVAPALIENASYSWSVQAFDGKLVSAWSAPQSFKVNAVEEAPGIPAAIAPVIGSVLPTATPVFSFGNVSDPDGDTVTYTLRLQRDGEAAAEYSGIVQGEGQSVFTPAEPLVENARYVWSVRASDGQLVSAWSAPQCFLVNALPEAPGAPALVAPAAGEAIDGSAQLTWGEAVDPDPGASVGYRLQIADESGFAAPLIEEELAGTGILFGDCTGYADLSDGGTYYWRVLAIDNEGLVSEGGSVGSFVYDTTVLAVAANVPGTRIYLGGNYAYAGQYIGETPVELRDLAPGTYRIVAERAGLETFVSQVTLGERQNDDVAATLIAALAPAGSAHMPLSAGGQRIVAAGAAAPFVVDLDGDLNLDLLVADTTGALTVYRGLPSADGDLLLTAGSSLGQFLTGSVPFIADWNNDGRADLLLGEQNGTVSLYIDQNASGLPRYAAGQHLTVAGVPIQVDNIAAPAVVDFDNDGDKDLLVGDGSGALYLYTNNGSDEAPVLAAPTRIAQLAAPASYFLSDWNADGRRDLLSANGAVVSVALRNADGTFAPAQVVADLTVPGSRKGSVETLRLFACDYDNAKGKDLFAGTAGGQVYLAKGNGKDLLPSVQDALLARIGQLEELASPVQSAGVGALRVAAEAGDYKEVRRQCETLLATAAGEIAAALDEIASLLK